MSHGNTPIAVLLGLATVACTQPLMDDQPRYEPYEASSFFPDGLSSRPLVDGTVARGQLRDDDHLYTGRVGGVVVDTFPFPIERDDLERGRNRFEIYCSPCHDRTGSGNGIIVQRGFKAPLSFYGPTVLNAPAGRYFEVISEGIGVMPDYAMQLEPADRWRVAAYIRALQFSQRAPLAAVPPAQRATLEEERP